MVKVRESVRVVKVRVGFPQYVCHRELIWDKAPCRFHVEYVARSKVPWMVTMRLFRRDGAPFFINSVTGATPGVAIGKMTQHLNLAVEMVGSI